MKRALGGTVAVITGASSGIGLATALAFAQHRCQLVLVGRDSQRLGDALEQCHAAGGDGIAVAADIGDATDIARVVDRAVERFGRIDTWVNSAAVIIVGEMGTESVDELDRLVRTNVLGTMLASRAALAQFRSQGSGVLINVSSLLAFLPAPVLPAYVMSKFATSGLTLSLHAAARRTPGIDVCLVEPGPVDTPMFARAANHTGRELRALPTACSPARAAAVIVGCARRPRRRVVIGWSGRVISAAHHVAPATTERVAGAAISRLIVRSTAEAPSSNGLFEWRDRPVVVDGGWRRNRVRRALGDAVGRAVVARVGRDRRAHADEPVGRR